MEVAHSDDEAAEAAQATVTHIAATAVPSRSSLATQLAQAQALVHARMTNGATTLKRAHGHPPAVASLSSALSPEEGGVDEEPTRLQAWSRPLSLHSSSEPVRCVCVSPDGSVLAVAAGRGVQLLHSPSMTPLCTLPIGGEGGTAGTDLHATGVRLMRWSPPTTSYPRGLLLTVGVDRRLALWNVSLSGARGGARLERVLGGNRAEASVAPPAPLEGGHRDVILDAVFSRRCGSGSGLLLTCGGDGLVLGWEWERSGCCLGVFAREARGGVLRALALHESTQAPSAAAAAGAAAGAKLLLSAPDGRVLLHDAHSRESLGCLLEPDSSWRASSGAGGSGPASSGGWVDGQRFHTGRVGNMAVSDDGSVLATCSDDRTVKLWSVLSLRRDAKAVQTSTAAARAAPPPSHLVPLHPSDQLSGVDGEEMPLSLGFRASLLHTLRHDSPVSSARFTPDSSLLLSAADRSMRLWVVDSGELIYQVALPSPISDWSLTPSPVVSFDSAPLEEARTKRSFFVGRVHVAAAERVLAIDLALVETRLHPPTQPQRQTAEEHDQEEVKDSSVRADVSPRKPRRKRAHPSAPALTQLTQPHPARPVVASDALVAQLPSGAAKLLAELSSDPTLSSSASNPASASGAALNTAPHFLHQLLSGPVGGSVDRNVLLHNMRHFGLSATHLLRLVAACRSFTPAQVLTALATPMPACQSLYQLALAGMPIDQALLDMGLHPSLNSSSATGGGRSVAAAPSVAALSTARPEAPFEASGGRAIGPSGGEAQLARVGEQDVNYLAPPLATGGEGLFFSPATSSAVPPSSAAGTRPTEGEMMLQRVRWEPATQLNLLAHLSSSTSLTLPRVHASAALDPSATKFPLFAPASAEQWERAADNLRAREQAENAQRSTAAATTRADATLLQRTSVQQPQVGSVHRGAAISRAYHTVPAIPSLPLSTLSPASRDSALTTFVGGQVLPAEEGSATERAAQRGRARAERTGSHTARSTGRSSSQAQAYAASTRTSRAPLNEHGVAIPLRRSLGLKAALAVGPTDPAELARLAAEERRKQSEADRAAPFGTRSFRKPTREQAVRHVRSTLESFDARHSEPTPLVTLLQSFSPSEIEYKARERAARLRGQDLPPADTENKEQQSALDVLSPRSAATRGAGASAKLNLSAGAMRLRDDDLRRELRRTLLHQADSLSSLDVDNLGGVAVVGAGAAGVRESVRPLTHAQEVMVAPFGDGGLSALTLTPRPSAHHVVRRGIGRGWRQAGALAPVPQETQGEEKALASGKEHTLASPRRGAMQLLAQQLEPTPTLSSLPQRMYALPLRARGRSRSPDPESEPESRSRSRSPSRSASNSPTRTGAVSGVQLTALAQAFGEKKYKWINRFSRDVPGLDVVFSSSTLPPSPPALHGSTVRADSLAPPRSHATQIQPQSSSPSSSTAAVSARQSKSAKHGRRAAAAAPSDSVDATSVDASPPTAVPAATIVDTLVSRPFLLRPSGDEHSKRDVALGEFDQRLAIGLAQHLADTRPALDAPQRIDLWTDTHSISSNATVYVPEAAHTAVADCDAQVVQV